MIEWTDRRAEREREKAERERERWRFGGREGDREEALTDSEYVFLRFRPILCSVKTDAKYLIWV